MNGPRLSLYLFAALAHSRCAIDEYRPGDRTSAKYTPTKQFQCCLANNGDIHMKCGQRRRDILCNAYVID